MLMDNFHDVVVVHDNTLLLKMIHSNIYLQSIIMAHCCMQAEMQATNA